MTTSPGLFIQCQSGKIVVVISIWLCVSVGRIHTNVSDIEVSSGSDCGASLSNHADRMSKDVLRPGAIFGAFSTRD